MLWLAIIGVLTSVLSAYYYLHIIVMMYFREGEADLSSSISPSMLMTIILCAVLVLFFGLFPSVLVQIAQQFL